MQQPPLFLDHSELGKICQDCKKETSEEQKEYLVVSVDVINLLTEV